MLAVELGFVRVFM